MGSHEVLWYYRDHISRLVSECLEVALVVCITDLHDFTLAKIFDIFNQLLPTSFVLNTGYWPFYDTAQKKCLCICGRYGFDCRHFKHGYHWIDLMPVPDDSSVYFSTKFGTLRLVQSEIVVDPLVGTVSGYSMRIKLILEYKRSGRRRTRRRRDEPLSVDYSDQLIEVLINCRYTLQKEYYSAAESVVFQPNPFFYESYGSYFSNLLLTRQTFCKYPTHVARKHYTVSTDVMPHFSLVLQFASVPVRINRRSFLHTTLSSSEPVAVRKITYCKATQTENHEELKYRAILNELKEELNTTPEKDDPEIIDIIDVDGDEDWQVVTNRKRGKKKACRNVAKTEVEGNGRRCKRQRATLPAYYVSSVQEKKGHYKEDPDFQWFDKQFPDMHYQATIKTEAADEELDIAQEFINQENEKGIIKWK